MKTNNKDKQLDTLLYGLQTIRNEFSHLQKINAEWKISEKVIELFQQLDDTIATLHYLIKHKKVENYRNGK